MDDTDQPPDLAERLRRPECYPGTPADVEVLQTHISIVCLAGDDVYKLKRAVRLPFVDFSGRAARRHFCEEEVRLNRRLCASIYLGVTPLCRIPGGYRFDGGGEVVDWAVHMRRMPQTRMLDHLLASDRVAVTDMDVLAAIVADFHDTAARGAAVRRAGGPDRLAQLADQNFTETAGAECLDRELHGALSRRTSDALAALRPRLERRSAAGRIIEGHGDLHARNICMTDPPSIYDCIEFSFEFRCADVATENAFLVMDLIYRGRRDLAHRYAEQYAARSGDAESVELLPALCSYRAMVRAKVSALVSADPEIQSDDRKRAADSARRHMRLAATSLAEIDGPWFLIACGLPASGKSTVLAELARETGWPCLGTDLVRKELAGVAADTPADDQHYTPEFSDRSYATLLERASAAARTSPAVLLDGNFPTRARRAQTIEAALGVGARALILAFEVGEGTARARLAARSASTAAGSDADVGVYDLLRRRFEPPSDSENALRLDGEAPPADSLDAICTAMLSA